MNVPLYFKQCTLHATDICDLISDKDHFLQTICDLICESLHSCLAIHRKWINDDLPVVNEILDKFSCLVQPQIVSELSNFHCIHPLQILQDFKLLTSIPTDDFNEKVTTICKKVISAI